MHKHDTSPRVAAACEQRSSRLCALWCDIKVIKQCALSNESVQVWCLHHRIVQANVIPSLVINQQHQQVGLHARRQWWQRGARRRQWW